MSILPKQIRVVGTPPIKCQGIKTKLVPFILSSIQWNSGATGRWIEPFLGSGVVVLNLAPQRALLTDTNEHIIRLYRGIYDGEVSQTVVRDHLEHNGRILAAQGKDFYYEVRDRFNDNGSSLDFLFLNRSCFNGVMRFNSKGKFNVPFCHKPTRFAKSYVTKIVNQVGWMARQMAGKPWEFCHQPWELTIAAAQAEDFLYLDPPYVGRHADYFDSWKEEDAHRMAVVTQAAPCGYAVSMWMENRHRLNPHIKECWHAAERRLCAHFYHVGSTEELRNEMDEALLIRPGYATPDLGKQATRQSRAQADTQHVLELA